MAIDSASHQHAASHQHLSLEQKQSSVERNSAARQSSQSTSHPSKENAKRGGAALISSTSRLLINAAFLQEIKDSNPDLTFAMHSLRQTCESDETEIVIVRSLVRQLDDLRDRWAMQFALEESYGYMRVPATTSYLGAFDEHPRWQSDFIESLLSQHCTLYLMLHDLAECAEELQYRGVNASQLQKVVQRCRDFDQAVRDHEDQEQGIIRGLIGVPNSIEVDEA